MAIQRFRAMDSSPHDRAICDQVNALSGGDSDGVVPDILQTLP